MWELTALFSGIAFALACVLTILPKYTDDANVSAALAGVHRDVYGKDVSATEIKGRLSKYFQVNTVSDEVAQAVKVTNAGGRQVVTINYETREHFMGNIDIVINFKHEVDFSKPPEAAP